MESELFAARLESEETVFDDGVLDMCTVAAAKIGSSLPAQCPITGPRLSSMMT